MLFVLRGYPYPLCNRKGQCTGKEVIENASCLGSRAWEQGHEDLASIVIVLS